MALLRKGLALRPVPRVTPRLMAIAPMRRRLLSTAAPAVAATKVLRPRGTQFVPKPKDSRTRTVTLFPGDGVGPEVSQVVVDVYKAMRVPVEWERFDRKPESKKLPDGLIDSLKRNTVGLKGSFKSSVGGDYASLNMLLRQELQLYADVVDCFSIPGITTRHDNVNVTIIRENCEGEYSGMEHEVVPGVVESVKVMSKDGCARIVEFAFEYAFLNNRKKVTAVHKANIQKQADGLFLKVAREVAKKYPQIAFQDILIDNCCEKIISNPNMFDVMVTPNLYGSLLSNICCGLVGGPGICGGANVGNGLAVFEQGARHVGADIAGKNLANPTGMLFASVMLLRHLSLPGFADRLERAVLDVHATRAAVTADIGGTASTTDFTKALLNSLEKL